MIYQNHSYIIKVIITVVYMISKIKEKQKAIKLRKKGLSYNEILKLVPVAKSTLSVWLREIGMAKRQKQRLTEKRRAAQFKAQQAWRDKRIKLTEEIKSKAREEINKISKRELWLIGTALYWAEGSKQKEWNVSQGVRFSNSDPMMIKLFLFWLKEICDISDKDIRFEIYLHKNSKNDCEKIKKYWSKITKFPLFKFQGIIWKKHKIKTIRKNIKEGYYGLLRIVVLKSTNFNRKILGWIEGIIKDIGE